VERDDPRRLEDRAQRGRRQRDQRRAALGGEGRLEERDDAGLLARQPVVAARTRGSKEPQRISFSAARALVS
jgi:hypothetical protein